MPLSFNFISKADGRLLLSADLSAVDRSQTVLMAKIDSSYLDNCALVFAKGFTFK